ncbi:MAG: hypothetical protein MJZ16_02170 [Bacteroidales bacterium]|nr:hypothetical protein [Bacteroidales bacterium]
MMRGTATFLCPKCGKVFRAPDIELGATVYTMPQPCPVCRTESDTISVSGLVRKLIMHPRPEMK